MRGSADYTTKTLNGRNLVWLVATIALDVVALIVLAFQPSMDAFTLTRVAAIRAGLTALLPIPVLILSSLISADHKAILVFWRIQHPLPGSRAFSVHALADQRIDLAQLKKKVGAFPVGERDQNSKWYVLYKQVASEPSVVDSHKNYLLFRDIAALSFLIVPLLPPVTYFSGMTAPRIVMCTAWFLGQYLVAAFAARTTGIAFVKNVLAVHASRKVSGTKTAKKESES